MGVVQLQNPAHPMALLQKANQMRQAGMLCDVVIVVDGREFCAHRTVLACTSKMFQILFTRHSQHYSLDFLSPKTFQQILEYAYTASLQARLEDLDDLLYAAEILEIEYLEEQCLKILETIQTTEENDTEVGFDDGGTEEDGNPRERLGRDAYTLGRCPKEEQSWGSSGQNMRRGNRMEQSPSVTTSLGLSPTSPTKVAVDSLMSLGQSLLQSRKQDPQPALGSFIEVTHAGASAGHRSPKAEEASSSSSGEMSTEACRGTGDPGTPTRGSVITSAREMHHSRGSASAGTHLLDCTVPPPSLFSATPNHRSTTIDSMSSLLVPSMHMSPHLAMSMELGSYGTLLPPSLVPREIFSLGELANGVGRESMTQSNRWDVCGSEQLDSEATKNDRQPHSGVKTYGCEFCGKRFLDSLRLRMHRLSHSGPDMAVFCLLCGKRFQTQTSLQQHMEVHADVHSYTCSECERTFPSHTALRRHLRSHTGDHPFECEFCGSCFRDETTLKTHKRIHTGEKPYECNGCGKKFSLKHQLETHYRVHTGEKPFECKLCHQRSRDYSAMIKHLRTHNGASPYQCTVCLEYCPSLSAMQKHMKSHRPEDIPADWRIEKSYLYLCYV
ncbi:zinc finger and BTB domain-containing protein 16-A isoform X2 [Scleropages formosus]|uniref:Zinc finger and BTB domain containing 16 n=1 Tax=Scleropages formosus TaxID=113540 RepID=A0A8C9R366_SCLFO|nr:zinc finger and BTB domain-containing protein 16-A-like isoform X2 [Scleropages formosus]